MLYSDFGVFGVLSFSLSPRPPNIWASFLRGLPSTNPSPEILPMRLSWQRIRLKVASAFRTAKAVRTDKETLWVRLEHGGIEGWGEAVPMDTYNQTLASAEQALKAIASESNTWVGSAELPSIESITQDLLRRFDDQRATVAAIDGALHDWVGKRFGIPVARWLGLDPADLPLSSYTIGIDDPRSIAAKARAARSYPILKIKVGTPHDEETLSTIREIAPQSAIRLDANMAWSVEEALDCLPRLVKYGIEFVEQPVAADDIAGLRTLKEAAICPIVADESCVRPADVVKLGSCVDGINIKLSKCGGICEAMKMIHLARGLGLKIMLGCMIESSLGIAAAVHLGSLVDWLDLDGHLLLAEDPFTGIGGREGRILISEKPGLGVLPV